MIIGNKKGIINYLANLLLPTPIQKIERLRVRLKKFINYEWLS
jgi:hypothetical protein